MMKMRGYRKFQRWGRIGLCMLFSALGSLACERQTPQEIASTSQPALVSRARSFEVMGTLARLTAVAADEPTADAALQAGCQALEEVNRLMSDYIDDSEIGRLNRAAAGEAIPLSPPTMHCLRRALEISAQSGGAFDVTCRPLIQLWRTAAREKHLPDEEKLRTVHSLIGADKIMLDEMSRTAARRLDGVQVDLGGIAKGYALDLAAEAMKKAGSRGGLVDVGGDIVSFGLRENGQLWRIGVRDPFAVTSGEYRYALQFEDAAVATSGVQERFFEIDGKRYSHIIDPRDGRPAEQAPSVTVIGPDGLTADAWATAFSVLSVAEGKALLQEAGAPAVEVLWISGTAENPQIEMTAGFKSYICP